MPSVSVIIPTHNRPAILEKAVESVLGQTFQDFELIIVDDGGVLPLDTTQPLFTNPKIRMFRHEKSLGGGAARNTGIRNARGEYVAFLDDDDFWLPNKLEIQMEQFFHTPDDVGFSFGSVYIIMNEEKKMTNVHSGVKDFHELSLTNFKGFLTSTLVVKKYVFQHSGLFDETLPSHQEAELVIRITKKYKGMGINIPLVVMLMTSGHVHIGSYLEKRIMGRERVLEKHIEEYIKYPRLLAINYFRLGIFLKKAHHSKEASGYFFKAWILHKTQMRFLFHYIRSHLFHS
ncbi:MAG TPA: hypothetical protein DCY48_04615 [Candidatus Magasanikbacteria bacterium]|nr:MAG: hypothetical protein A3I74_03105 [Candidatus Magasanikbacteria bacterium RIFCSPLOWO2_02_FULL_47_16]OGH80200.1 MAG: hypothetical protein A3C10_03385 [Candidatus Magasanikbacteria bacterium RIFCSPHIGHO2_02_FULL_48_18]HAZ29024.1 hypothetical protein [Candidatus Magasanikbacteria bacterium]